MNNQIYLIALLLSAVWMIEILKASNFEKAFKQNKVWQIKSFYVVIALVGAHLIASFIERVFELFQLN
ncbi:putative membrane protein YwzB [Acholeplasma morum]|jgi:uncharacterized membrane protein YwzB|uniref:DUF1146 family protein n=1 Tax=Paracholeplasma morum TaxID=264637 RepID=UPI00195B30F5|nr:DUF1146 family protein [Paracholeplasma morum]MBM7452856.1 putative membrane protein YwzB [Paracholeplasma morum]